MAIEVTSIQESGRTISLRRLAASLSAFFNVQSSSRRLMFRSICGVLTLSLLVGAYALLTSYKYYSRIIDARLASGYLTSRPGLYAAPRVIHTGQKYSQEKLVTSLRRAGYVESDASDVWSGGFIQHDGEIEINPAGASKKRSRPVTV